MGLETLELGSGRHRRNGQYSAVVANISLIISETRKFY